MILGERMITPPVVWKRSIVICVSVCCLCVREHIS